MRRYKSVTALAAGVVLAVVAISGFANGYNGRAYTVEDSSFMVLPAVTPNTTNTWFTSNVYSRGDYALVYTNLNGNKRWNFWCITAGTSTNVGTPVWTTTNDVTEGEVTWRFINPTRDAFVIQNLGASQATVSYDFTAVYGAGQTLLATGGNAVNAGYGARRAYQGAVYAISQGSTTNSIAVHEE